MEPSPYTTHETITFCRIIVAHYLLYRSAAYFSSLANGEPLPVKRRLEPVVGTGLTVGNLDVLVQQHKGLTDKNVTKMLS